MKDKESAFVEKREAPGLLLGGAGVLAFSFTLVATRAADADFGALTVGVGRAVVAAGLAIALLRQRKQPLLPPTQDRAAVVRLALTVVLGFPLLTAIALAHVSAAHAAVVVGLAPVATAGFAVLLAGDNPSRIYWWSLGVGVIAVLTFAAVQGAGRPRVSDALVLVAVGLVGYGYAEGGMLSRRHDGATVICWAVVTALPVTLPLTVLGVLVHPPSHVSAGALAGLTYVSLVSMFLGFILWYHGLAVGGVARVGQLQLAQPVLTLVWAALLLGERLTVAGVVAASVVLGSVAVGRRRPTVKS